MIPTSRVAIAHDYLTQRGGAERVVLAMARAFPEAPIFTTLYRPEGTYPEFADRRIVVSALNRLPPFRNDPRKALPLLPAVSSGIRIDADVVLASSSGWAHGFRTDGRKVVYCHNPARWLYQTDEYIGVRTHPPAVSVVLNALKRGLKTWDQRAAATADRYLANSTVVQGRIRQAYGIQADVLHPPPGLDADGFDEPLPGIESWGQDGFHLVVSRLQPYKNVEVATRLFSSGGLGRLVVIGSGLMREQLRAESGPEVSFHQGISDEQLRWAYRHAKAVLAPSFEDFGLTPIEAGLFGAPVVALRNGGYLDSVNEGITGLFFDEPTEEAVGYAVRQAREHPWDQEVIREHAAAFGQERFAQRLRQVVGELTAK